MNLATEDIKRLIPESKESGYDQDGNVEFELFGRWYTSKFGPGKILLSKAIKLETAVKALGAYREMFKGLGGELVAKKALEEIESFDKEQPVA